MIPNFISSNVKCRRMCLTGIFINTLYSGKNEELWNEYGAGRITKDELNEQRFAYPLLHLPLIRSYSNLI